jgi:ataxin-3
MNNDNDESKFVYWEKQGKDRLCGLHSLNSLVQGPLFNESNLCTIALEIDQLEKDLYEGDAPTPTNSQDGTNNIAMDGNYNVQVLTKALLNTGEYDIEPIDKPGIKDANTSFSDEQGFI